MLVLRPSRSSASSMSLGPQRLHVASGPFPRISFAPCLAFSRLSTLSTCPRNSSPPEVHLAQFDHSCRSSLFCAGSATTQSSECPKTTPHRLHSLLRVYSPRRPLTCPTHPMDGPNNHQQVRKASFPLPHAFSAFSSISKARHGFVFARGSFP